MSYLRWTHSGTFLLRDDELYEGLKIGWFSIFTFKSAPEQNAPGAALWTIKTRDSLGIKNDKNHTVTDTKEKVKIT